MTVKNLPINCYFDVQRFRQFSPQDAANWVLYEAPSGKKKIASYPAMGRRHIRFLNINRLVFPIEPREIFRSIDFVYVIVGDTVYQVDRFYNTRILPSADFTRDSGVVNFAYLPVIQVPASPAPQYQRVFCMLTDGVHIYVIDESQPNLGLITVTDANAPVNPNAVAAFGNRFVVSSRNSTEFRLTQINMGGVFNPATIFTIDGKALFAQESGIIQQFGVLHNKLYIFLDFNTGIWSNVPSVIPGATVSTTFPWKKNTSYDWDYGIADPKSLDIDFGRMVWLGKNKNGLINFMTSSDNAPEPISTQAINVLLQNSSNADQISPFLADSADGFLYQFEDTVFYRVSARTVQDLGETQVLTEANCLEFNFDTKTWHRNIEVDSTRNRIQKHVFFNNIHLVTVEGQGAIFEMSGSLYFNELQNPDVVDPQDPLAFIAYPFRYEAITQILSEDDYSEFITDYVEIDFVWGDQSFIRWDGPYANTVFIIKEGSSTANPIFMVTEDGTKFIIQEGTDTPELDSTIYNAFFKPHIELYVSDDGGISFYSADVREFSQLGVYQWRMRWYQLGASRNRVYKLVAVSPSPIVILGGVQNVRRSSGGAN